MVQFRHGVPDIAVSVTGEALAGVEVTVVAEVLAGVSGQALAGVEVTGEALAGAALTWHGKAGNISI